MCWMGRSVLKDFIRNQSGYHLLANKKKGGPEPLLRGNRRGGPSFCFINLIVLHMYDRGNAPWCTVHVWGMNLLETTCLTQ